MLKIMQTGGLFNPAVTFARMSYSVKFHYLARIECQSIVWAIGGVTTFRAAILTVAQIAGGILGAGLVALLIP